MKRSNSAPLIAYSEGRELPTLGLQRRQGMSNSNMSLPADCGKLEVSISPTKQVRIAQWLSVSWAWSEWVCECGDGESSYERCSTYAQRRTPVHVSKKRDVQTIVLCVYCTSKAVYFSLS